MASDHVIDEIKQRIDLVDYIGRAVDLKRAGRTFKACCPFHVEKTPSFVVFPHTQTWRCFGACGDGGDIFKFVQKREGLGFGEALQLLARQAGVEIETETPEQSAARAERDKYLAMCDVASSLFQEWLRERPDAQSCRDYVNKRGLTATTITQFGLGYAPDSWDTLLNEMTARGYEPQDLVVVGLARERDNGGYYDYFRHRLMFPIRDVRGRTIGFGARALSDEQNPKYLNSPQTPLFDKGRNLYALELARDAIRTQERVVVVEGYMDVIAAHQFGFTNVVASLGTALTSAQIQLLNRYSPNITLALDADEAGQRAAERGLDTVLNFHRTLKTARWERERQGKATRSQPEGDIRVLVLPEGKDPDDLIRKEPQRWPGVVENALPVIDFLIQRRVKTSDLRDPVQKARVADDLLPMIGELESAVVRDHYVRYLARLLQTDERTLTQELGRTAGQARKQEKRASTTTESPPPAPPSYYDEGPPPDDEWYELPPEAYADDVMGDWSEPNPTVAPTPRTHEGFVLYLLMERPADIKNAQDYGLTGDMWQLTEHRQIWEALVTHPPVTSAHLEEFADELDPPIARSLRQLVAYYSALPAVLDTEREDVLFEQLDSVILHYEETQARQLQYLIDELQRMEEYDPSEMQALQKQTYQLVVNRHQRQRVRLDRLNHRKPLPR